MDKYVIKYFLVYFQDEKKYDIISINHAAWPPTVSIAQRHQIKRKDKINLRVDCSLTEALVVAVGELKDVMETKERLEKVLLQQSLDINNMTSMLNCSSNTSVIDYDCHNISQGEASDNEGSASALPKQNSTPRNITATVTVDLFEKLLTTQSETLSAIRGLTTAIDEHKRESKRLRKSIEMSKKVEVTYLNNIFSSIFSSVNV